MQNIEATSSFCYCCPSSWHKPVQVLTLLFIAIVCTVAGGLLLGSSLSGCALGLLVVGGVFLLSGLFLAIRQCYQGKAAKIVLIADTTLLSQEAMAEIPPIESESLSNQNTVSKYPLNNSKPKNQVIQFIV